MADCWELQRKAGEIRGGESALRRAQEKRLKRMRVS